MYTWNTWTNALFNYMAVNSTGVPNSPTGVSSFTDPIWAAAVPSIIDYGEQRAYRELDLLATRVDQLGILSSGQRNFNLPTTAGSFMALEGLTVVTPSSAVAATGNKNPLVAVSRAELDFSWPAQSTAFTSSIGTPFGVPQYYAMVDYGVVALGPLPDQSYPVICNGTIRPAPLSSANQTTYLTTVLPDLWMAVTMVGAELFARDWGGTADDPQAGQNWEAQYQKALKSAGSEEARMQFRSAGWTAQMARPETTPPRQ
jgi:hypothetical protein